MEQEITTNITKTATGGTIVNGVELPRHVVTELEKLGLDLSWYNSGELQQAVMACAVDGVLIDDPNGTSFSDKLELTDEEKSEAEEAEFGTGFRGMIKRARKKYLKNWHEPDKELLAA